MARDASRFGVGKGSTPSPGVTDGTQELPEEEEVMVRVQPGRDGGGPVGEGHVAMNPTGAGGGRLNQQQQTKGDSSPATGEGVQQDTSPGSPTPTAPTGGSPGGVQLNLVREGGTANDDGGGVGTPLAFGTGAVADSGLSTDPDLSFGSGDPGPAGSSTSVSPMDAAYPLVDLPGDPLDVGFAAALEDEAPVPDADTSWLEGGADPGEFLLDEAADVEGLE